MYYNDLDERRTTTTIAEMADDGTLSAATSPVNLVPRRFPPNTWPKTQHLHNRIDKLFDLIDLHTQQYPDSGTPELGANVDAVNVV